MAQVTRTRMTLCSVALLGVLASSVVAQAITLDLPTGAKIAATKVDGMSSYLLPVAGFVDGKIESRRFEGAMTQTVWQMTAPGQTTLEMLMPLRAQLVKAGYKVLFECETVACGGFDFRYGTLNLPEPDMHVDLGDFRFLAASKGAEAISLMISRSSAVGFVQMTQVGGAGAQDPALMASAGTTGQVALSLPATAAIAMDRAAAPTDLGASLMTGVAVALDDLVFTSGASALSEGTYPSLKALGAWLTSNPDVRVALVGHTDASGGLEPNIVLSRKRAQSVRQRMIDRYGIPTAQIDAEGVGYLAPRASNMTAEGRDENRRVEVMMTSTP